MQASLAQGMEYAYRAIDHEHSPYLLQKKPISSRSEMESLHSEFTDFKIECGKKLAILGIQFDQIEKTASVWQGPLDSTTSLTLEEWWALATTLSSKHESIEETSIEFEITVEPDLCHGLTEAGFWRTACFRNLPDLNDSAEDRNPLGASKIGDLKQGRLFAITSSGSMCLVPADANVGDVVCILYGSPVPYILRSCVETPGHFKIVGESYVHGKMDGEIVAYMEGGWLKESVFMVI